MVSERWYIGDGKCEVTGGTCWKYEVRGGK